MGRLDECLHVHDHSPTVYGSGGPFRGRRLGTQRERRTSVHRKRHTLSRPAPTHAARDVGPPGFAPHGGRRPRSSLRSAYRPEKLPARVGLESLNHAPHRPIVR
ncbi:hypothetical protein JCM9534A_11460 [Catenuloplanes indicus JCM 9534]